MKTANICEYTKKKRMQSLLSRFNSDQAPVVLFSERAYYFDLCRIKNMRHILFYSLPQNAGVYKELLASFQYGATQRSRVAALFSRFDALLLERIVGSRQAEEMLAEYNKATKFII